MSRIPTVAPAQYVRIATLALVALTVIVFTGAAVRLTGSGLGCPRWPKCTDGQLYTPLQLHGLIEFGNRTLSAIVSITALAAAFGAWRRRPFRRDLLVLAVLLPIGVIGQAVMGGLTVIYHLSPGWVMAHFALSMVILIAAVALVWKARHEPADDAPRPEAGRSTVLAVRALVPLGALAIFAGTAATAAGPHAGGEGTNDVVPRLDFWGGDTLARLVHGHGTIAAVFGLAAVGTWWLARRRRAGEDLRDALTALCLLVGAQGVIGSAQYAMHLPGEMVWLHVVLATLTWLAVLWCVAAAGRLDYASSRSTAKPATATAPAAASIRPRV